METDARRRGAALIAIGAAWLLATGLLLAYPRLPVDIEAHLWHLFPTVHRDAYEGVNRFATAPFLIVLVSWIAASAGMLVARRRKLLVVNLLGPLTAAMMLLPFVDFADPEWFTIGAVIVIGCLVGLLVATAFWIPRQPPPDP